MEFWRFIFSSFWVWLGFVILVLVIGGGAVDLARACKRGRRVTGQRMGQRWNIEIENASAEDAQNAFVAVTCAPNGETEQEGRGNERPTKGDEA